MWKCGFYLAKCRHPINFSKVMVQKANPFAEVVRHGSHRNTKPFRLVHKLRKPILHAKHASQVLLLNKYQFQLLANSLNASLRAENYKSWLALLYVISCIVCCVV